MDQLANSSEAIDIIADKLLDLKPDPIPKYILLKEFKKLPESDNELQNTYEEVLEHPFITAIYNEQEESGYWKEFHGYSESIIRRLLFMGLDENYICLKRAADFIEGVLAGKDIWHQRIEKQDTTKWWLDMFMPLASASMLSLINPGHPQVKKHADIWKDFANEAFRNGQYDPAAESKAQLEYFGFKTRRTIPFYNYYVILLLTSKDNIIPESLDDKILEYCFNYEEGIYYVYGKCPKTYVAPDNMKDCYNWLRTVSILSRFQSWEKYKARVHLFLWNQNNPEGLWDFHKKPYGSMFPLSNSWRKDSSRMIDSSIFMLRILSRWKGF